MSDAQPVIRLARHGKTAWTVSDQELGVVDPDMTEWTEPVVRHRDEMHRERRAVRARARDREAA